MFTPAFAQDPKLILPLLSACAAAGTNTLDEVVPIDRIAADTAAVAVMSAFWADGANSLPNWNLDSDRGFAWPQWDVTTSEPWTDASFHFC
jgi:hypothetical protein